MAEQGPRETERTRAREHRWRVREMGKEEVRISEDTGKFKVWRKEIEGLN